ncbi:Vacuolar protein-sorting-associated protein 28 [Mycoemilia scoparia]|uniref:Vacuolar protein-sorting-associated protein 28 n=1 Tax=Mycoemilia scoparia TaxID=417184 RepID=A0A9W8DLJ6_9FUNG|nr:Vacuolar protein-sorting-associated protein 28 [Mycoemilia scoparia]
MFDRMADLYAILISLERLEYAFIRDHVPASDSPQDFISRYKVGVPATVEHGSFSSSSVQPNKRSVAEATEKFITLMDAVKLNQVSVDTLHPRLGDLLESLNNVDGLSRNSNGRAMLLEWLKRLNGMRASDQLDEDQARQFMFEVEQAYDEFFKSLDHSK